MSALKGYQAVASASAANLKAAAARIQDTDYALETANLTKAAILNQSANGYGSASKPSSTGNINRYTITN